MKTKLIKLLNTLKLKGWMKKFSENELLTNKRRGVYTHTYLSALRTGEREIPEGFATDCIQDIESYLKEKEKKIK